MAVLVPGTLLKLLQQMNSDTKPEGEHRSSLLQVVSIIPALAGSDLYTSEGYYLKISDSSHAAYTSLPEGDNDLILSAKIQLGQFVYIDQLEEAMPVPILRGVRVLPRRRPCIGNPVDVPAIRSRSHNAEKTKVKKSNAASKLEALDVKKAASLNSVEVSSRSMTRSVTSSPARTCYLPSRSVDKLSNGVKQQANTASSKMGLLQKAASVLKATAAARKSSAGNLLQNLSLGEGPKSLRKSWNVNGVAKTRDASNPIPAKSERTKPEIRSSSVPRRKLPDDEKPLRNEDNKSPSTEKKLNSSLTLNGQVSDKPSMHIADKKSGAQCNSTLSKLVKAASARKLSTNTTSWQSLPSSLANLGKEVMKQRDAAEKAAIEAIQEASAAEKLIRCLGLYAELTGTGTELTPQQTVEQFLTLHSMLNQSTITTPRTVAYPARMTWTRDEGLEENFVVLLAGKLKEETTEWFTGYMEQLLDDDVAECGASSDRVYVAGMLSHLKKVNDWLEVIGSGPDGVATATVERLRRKMYAYLLKNVDSAVVALNNDDGSGRRQVMMVQPKLWRR